MPTNIWRGDSQAQAQVNTHTIGGTAANAQVYSVTINLKVVSYTASGADTNTTIAAALQALLAASTIPEFKEAVWTVVTTVITGTAFVPGVPFTATSAATGTGTLVAATTVASLGPNHWDDPDNWTLAAVPVNSDDVWLTNNNVSILHGLGQSAVTLNAFYQDSTYTGTIGLPDYNGSYYEYRKTALEIKSATTNLGRGDSPAGGSSRIKINFSSSVSAVTVDSTGSSGEQGVPAVLLTGLNSTSSLQVMSGTVGVAFAPGSVATIPTVRVGFHQSPATDATVIFGVGATLTTINMVGGIVSARSNVTTLNIEDGSFTLYGSATLTTLNGDGGTIFYETVGTLTTANLGTGCTLDFRRDPRGRTVTNCTMQAKSSLYDSFKTVTFTNPLLLDRCGLSEVNLDLGSNFSIQRS